MAITINPVALLELLLKNRFNSKQKVVEYLESIAEEADSLARVWEEIVANLRNLKSVEIGETRFEELSRYSMPNAPFYARLAEFYRYLSIAVGGKLESDWHESMAVCLGSLLYHREVTLEEYRRFIKNIEGRAIFLDNVNEKVNLGELAESVAALHREAAKIHVLARTVRAL